MIVFYCSLVAGYSKPASWSAENDYQFSRAERTPRAKPSTHLIYIKYVFKANSLLSGACC